ncbi:uncharacterized protein LOC122506772 [Leptopilina heterotoma]|uniref:uncharacterized protein LOC122506772 n=1 Tax=Leptopilina heterotoma TaxID=63436 RepID=UPI001CA84A8A|nr:uncharacterized protein LOC122506772 [Leptopilina heterotoma]
MTQHNQILYRLLSESQMALNDSLESARGSSNENFGNYSEDKKYNYYDNNGDPNNILTQLNNMMTTIKDAFVNLSNSQTSKANGFNNKAKNVTNIDMVIPQFYDQYQDNPIKFLDNIKQYIKIKNVPNECESLIIKTALKGRAKSWFMSNNNKWGSFAQFEEDFLLEFFSIEFRTEMTNVWRDRRFGRMDKTFVNYFYQQVSYLEPPLADYSRNFLIIRQLPRKVQDVMAAVDLSDTNKVVRTLAWLDRTERGENGYSNRTREIKWDRDNDQRNNKSYDRNEKTNYHTNYKCERERDRENRERNGCEKNAYKNDKERNTDKPDQSKQNWRHRENKMEYEKKNVDNWRTEDRKFSRHENENCYRNDNSYRQNQKEYKHGRTNDKGHRVAAIQNENNEDNDNTNDDTNLEIDEILNKSDLN